MIIASFNVENLFARATALDTRDWKAHRPVVAAQARVNELFQTEEYDAATKQAILEQLEILGLLKSDEGPLVLLRKIRGQLLRRPRNGAVEVVAGGRGDWIGWVELKTEPADELAMRHTAMVMRDLKADVLGVVEADSRPLLKMFSARMLEAVGAQAYPNVMLIDGNDDRGIDVGILTRADHPIIDIRTHLFDTDDEGTIFSRDCCEYHVATPGGTELVVLVNHFKSKGYSSPGDKLGAKRRRRQARRVADIYRGLVEDGLAHVCVIGDLNDDPTSDALEPLLAGTDLKDISTIPGFDFGPRQGTYGSGNEADKIDYVLLSPALYQKATGGGVFRKGVWRGPRTKNPWDMYETLTREVEAASDHAAIWAEVDL